MESSRIHLPADSHARESELIAATDASDPQRIQ